MTACSTPALEETVGLIFAHITRFFLRALQWHQDNAVRSQAANETMTSLQYQEFVIAIQHETEVLHRLVATSIQRPSDEVTTRTGLSNDRGQAQAVSKNLTPSALASLHTYGTIYISDNATVQLGDKYCAHEEISGQISVLTTLVGDLREDLNRAAGLASSQHLDPGQAIIDNDYARVIDRISEQCLIDHRKTLSRLAVLCNQRPISSRTRSDRFWISPMLHDWAESTSHSYLFIKGTYKHRLVLRAFCVGIVQQLLSNSTPVLHVLWEGNSSHDLQEIFKSLVIQALRSDQCQNTGLHIHNMANASTSCQYMSVLAEILEHFPNVYIILNAEAMNSNSARTLRQVLRDLTDALTDRSARTTIRILVTSQTPRHAVDRSVHETVLVIRDAQLKSERRLSSVPPSGQKRPGSGHDQIAGLGKGQKRRRRR